MVFGEIVEYLISSLGRAINRFKSFLLEYRVPILVVFLCADFPIHFLCKGTLFYAVYLFFLFFVVPGFVVVEFLKIFKVRLREPPITALFISLALFPLLKILVFDQWVAPFLFNVMLIQLSPDLFYALLFLAFSAPSLSKWWRQRLSG